MAWEAEGFDEESVAIMFNDVDVIYIKRVGVQGEGRSIDYRSGEAEWDAITDSIVQGIVDALNQQVPGGTQAALTIAEQEAKLGWRV